MREPDYDSYTEEQLTQVLRSIDRDRFPERAAAAEHALNARKNTRIALEPPVPISTLPIQLASADSRRTRRVVLLAHLVFAGLILAWSPGKDIVIASLAFVAASALFALRQERRMITGLVDHGASLELSRDGESVRIPLDAIISVRLGGGENDDRIVLRLAFDTTLGDRLEFRPHGDLLEVHAQLDARVAAARQGTAHRA